MKNIGIELRSLGNLVMRFIENRARAQSCDLLTGSNGWILGYLLQNSDREVYQRELEEEFSITRSTASKVVNLMEKKGLVERKTAEHDARMLMLALTEKAEALALNMRRESENLSRILTRDFTPEEIETMYDYIKRMKKNLREEA
jgi:DNA-binding MarR family transcriptional regulator